MTPALADSVLQLKRDRVLGVIASKMTVYVMCSQPDVVVKSRPPLEREVVGWHGYHDAINLLQRVSSNYGRRLGDVAVGASRNAWQEQGYKKLKLPSEFRLLPDHQLKRLQRFYE